MKIKATIMVTLKTIVSSWKQVLLMFAIFPLVMTVILGNFQKSTYKPDIDMDKINIKIVDEDNSKASNDFKALFETENMKDIFSISHKEDYVITIPKGYEDNLRNLKDNKIKVDENKRVSKINEIIIRAVIDEYGKRVTEAMIISNKIGESSIADKEKLFNEIGNNINKLSQETALKNNMIKGERILTSFENQTTSMITLIIFTIIMSCIGAYNLDKSNGSFKRLMSTPMTKCDFFNLDLLIFFLSSLIYGAIYVISFRATGLAFKGINPLNIVAIIIGQSVLTASVAGFVIAFFNEKVSTFVVIILMYFQIIFGGGFIPLNEISNKVFLTLAKFAPGNVISQAYKSCLLSKSFTKELIIMLLISMLIYGISILKVKIKWEE